MAKHAFFLNKGGSGGGGGGQGTFALIKIEYPQGQNVTVTFDGSIIEAPDDSGLWMFGCEEIGTYTIAITGTTAEVEVEITTQGQIESVWISPQVINYALIYYLGNEFVNVDRTDEEKYAISTGGWSANGSIRWSGGLTKAWAKTNTNINITNWSKCFIRGKLYRAVGVGGGANLGVGVGIGKYDRHSDTMFSTTYNSYIRGVSEGSTISFLSLGESINGGNNPINLGGYSINGPELAFTKGTNKLNFYSSYDNLSVFSTGFVKIDDISGLSEYGNDIATILSNATDLFTDITTLNWMALNCTGDFMISALSNTNFVNAMNSSPNKSILVANEHWNRFIALLSV